MQALAMVLVTAQSGSALEGFVPLFNGRDLSGWKGLVKSPAERAALDPATRAELQKAADDRMRLHWRVRNGELHFDGKGDSLCTADDYADFELLADWSIEPGGDSGIYLRGTPQVQIWDDPAGSGGLYNNQGHPSQPLVRADRKAGEWNEFRIRMVGERVSVWLNGTLVTDNVTMENYWEREKPIYSSGQIELQAHGSPLRFRRLYIKRLGPATFPGQACPASPARGTIRGRR